MKSPKGLLVNKSFVGLVIALFVVSGIAYTVLKDQFASEMDAPPSLTQGSELLQGLIKTGRFLRFDADDFERTILLPDPVRRNRGVGYFYAETDMSMLEIANSIAPDDDLKLVIAHFGDNLDPLDNEPDRIFYSFPHGVYSNTKAINEENDQDYIIKAYNGFIIVASKDFGTWNLKSPDEMPLSRFDSMDTLSRGWNLIASNDLENTKLSCNNRVLSMWQFNKDVPDYFEELNLDSLELSDNSYLAWFYIGQTASACEDLSASSGAICVDKELTNNDSFICVNNTWIPCDTSTLGTSAFNSEFICNGTKWILQTENSISINTVLPSNNVPYESGNSVNVIFNEENISAVDTDITGVTITKKDGNDTSDKALEFSFNSVSNSLNIKYDLLEPITEYLVKIPANTFKRNGVPFESELSGSFVTSATALPPDLQNTSCVDDGTIILNGEIFVRECNSCFCNYGVVSCTKIYCGSSAITCTDGQLNDLGELCINNEYVPCNKKTLQRDEYFFYSSLKDGIFSSLLGKKFLCNESTFEWERLSNNFPSRSAQTTTESVLPDNASLGGEETTGSDSVDTSSVESVSDSTATQENASGIVGADSGDTENTDAPSAPNNEAIEGAEEGGSANKFTSEAVLSKEFLERLPEELQKAVIQELKNAKEINPNVIDQLKAINDSTTYDSKLKDEFQIRLKNFSNLDIDLQTELIKSL